jgi:hypothetical protein
MTIRPPTAKSPHAWAANFPTAKRPRSDNEIDKLYHTAMWRKFRECCLAFNPRCQRVVNGEQCTSPSSVAHHIVSPHRDKSVFIDWRNILCVCAEHHSGHEGEPVNALNKYVETKGMFGAVLDPNEALAVLRGDRIVIA